MKKNKLLLTGILGSMLLVGCNNNDTGIKLKHNEFKIEYGEKISTKASTYVTNPKDVKVTIDNKFSKDKITPCGTYIVKLIKNDEAKEVKVRVRDTKAPKWEDEKKNSIEVNKGTKIEEIYAQFKAYDLVGKHKENAKVMIKDLSKLDLNKAGKYEIQIYANDAGNNEISKKIEIIVKESNNSNINTNNTKKEEIKNQKSSNNSSKQTINATNTNKATQQQSTSNQQTNISNNQVSRLAPQPNRPAPQPNRPTPQPNRPTPQPSRPVRPVCRPVPAGTFSTRQSAINYAEAQYDNGTKDVNNDSYSVIVHQDPAYCNAYYVVNWF